MKSDQNQENLNQGQADLAEQEAEKSGMEQEKEGDTLPLKRKIVFWGGVLCVALGLGGIVWNIVESRKNVLRDQELREEFVLEGEVLAEATPQPTKKPEPTPTPEPEPTPDPLAGYEVPDRTIDFEGLWEQCTDVYAWLYVPGTEIDYPVLQHDTEPDYYLKRALDGSASTAGSIYTQLYNGADWMDRNTIIYGHNMRNGSMFASLHKYEDPQFMDEAPYVYIYTPVGVKVYEVFAAYPYSDVHLLFAFDMMSDQGFESYLSEVDAQRTAKGAHFKEGVEVNSSDRIVTLSTCIANKAENRFLVQAKLVAEGEMQ